MRHRGHALQPLTLSVQDPAARGAAPSQPQPAALGVHSLAAQILRLGIPAVPAMAGVLMGLRRRQEGAGARRRCLHRHWARL